MNFLASRDLVMTVTIEPRPALADLEARWKDLEGRADGSFFTSWTWIGAWLSTFREDGALPDVQLLAARAGDVVIGMALIGEAPGPSILKRRKALALHQSGLPEDDAIFVEYNDFLVDRRYAHIARASMLGFVAALKDEWREFRLNGVVPAIRQCVEEQNLAHRLHGDRLCPWIDLVKVTRGRSGYLASLSRNSRQQVQRSLRLYEAEGPVSLATAQDPAEARHMLDELRDLHQESWRQRKGHGGAFASARFERFVEALVAAGVPSGTVQLLRARAGATTIGCLLNFSYRGHVYAYQSGLAYRDDNRFRPGLVAHALAAVQAREQGFRGYHFMAGEGRYKSSLSNADEHLFWMTLRHDDLITRAEDFARGVKSQARRLLGM
jgi:CelD/BcsL family acetyltransferase involved in cellulose biosynthesis